MNTDEDPVKLPPQHLAEVVNALQAWAAAGNNSEKRRAARMEVQGSVTVVPLAKDGTLGKSFTAVTRDISFVGVGLMQSKVLEQGQQIIVRLPRGTRPALIMLCVVMYTRPLADGLYVVGAEFIRSTPGKEEQLLGKSADTELQQRARQLILN